MVNRGMRNTFRSLYFYIPNTHVGAIPKLVTEPRRQKNQNHYKQQSQQPAEQKKTCGYFGSGRHGRGRKKILSKKVLQLINLLVDKTRFLISLYIYQKKIKITKLARWKRLQKTFSLQQDLFYQIRKRNAGCQIGAVAPYVIFDQK